MRITRQVQLRHADHEARRIDREDLLKGVLRNYARFHMRNAFLEYPNARCRSSSRSARKAATAPRRPSALAVHRTTCPNTIPTP
jgi:hypothetical protein